MIPNEETKRREIAELEQVADQIEFNSPAAQDDPALYLWIVREHAASARRYSALQLDLLQTIERILCGSKLYQLKTS